MFPLISAAAQNVEADALRGVVLTLTALAVALFPDATQRQGRRRSAWWAIAGCELALLAGMIGIADKWGTPIVWYRTPAIGLASLLILVFVFSVYREPRPPR